MSFALVSDLSWKTRLRAALFATALTAFVALGVFGTLIFPPAAILFLGPLAVAIAVTAPALRAAPKRLVLPLVYVSVLMLPLWPVYLHVKPGPLPILTPPRLVLYVISALWVYDMTVSRLRRGQLTLAFKRSAPITAPVALLFLLGLLSLPLAQGKAIAFPEFFRQVTIWFVPFLAFATYVRRARELKTIAALLALAAGVSGAGAIAEYVSGKLLANLLSPFIGDGGEWLRVAQAEKIRDGVFRAQFTHTHPLSLGEFLAFGAPLAFSLAFAARNVARKFLWAVCLALIVGGALATASRGAVLAILLALSIAGGIFALRFLKTAAAWRFKPAFGLICALAVIASPAIGVGAYRVISGEPGESTARSSQGRIDQMEQAWPKILKRPSNGYGSGRAARVLGFYGTTLTIDNYYLTLALDLGLGGPIVLAAMFIGMGALSAKRARGAPRDLAGIYIGLAGGAGALFVMRMIVSQTSNLSILYVLLGGMAGAICAQGRLRARPDP